MNKYKKLFYDTWTDTINNGLFKYLYPTSSFAGLFGVPLLLKNTGVIAASTPWWVYVLIVFVPFALFYLIFLVYNLWLLLHHLYVDSIYVDVIEIRKDLSLMFNSFINSNGNENNDEAQNAFLISYCDKIKLGFDKLLHSDTHVSIKVIMRDFQRPSGTHDAKVCNLCRDSKSLNRDTRQYLAANHTLFGNTTFSTIVNSVSRNKTSRFFYLNNDILADKNYQNTSMDLGGSDGLPYRSELVVPIFVNRQGEEIDYGILGFLCLDSSKENTFEKYIDCEVSLLSSIAADLFTIINQIDEE